MSSPNAATPYEVLGVSSSASMDDLRRAYRKKLRETHPDTGGDAAEFHAVQHAWTRIGTLEDRASYEKARMRDAASAPRSSGRPPTGAPEGTTPSPFSQTRSPTPPPAAPQEPAFGGARETPAEFVPARSYGHPGGWNREQYFLLMREWVGRGSKLDPPYDAAMVRAAPREIRHLLADAIAEEETAKTVSALGVAYTVWHDVATDLGGSASDVKLDHLVLGPTGVFAILSEDWGGPVGIRKGELVGDSLGVGEKPMKDLARRTKSVARSARIRFTALVIVVPDGAAPESLAVIGKERGTPTIVVHRSRLSQLLLGGIAGVPRLGADELFATRDDLQRVIRFV